MKTKTIFISAFLLFASSLFLRAQVTYEYGAVTYSVVSAVLYVSVSTGDNYTESKVKSKFDSRTYFMDLSPLEEKVNELAKDGWEVFSTSSTSVTNAFHLTYHLRRKKP